MLRAESQVEEALEQALALGEAGVQVAAYLDGDLVVDSWAGHTDPERTSSDDYRVDGSTLFPVFSVTKAFTATAVHLQAERGLIDYDAAVALYWPEYGVNGKEHVTLRHVLTHRAGVPAMPEDVTPERLADWEWMLSRLARMEPEYQPGTANTYLAYVFGWILGEVVRRTDPERRPFDVFVEDEICRPLEIDSFFLGVPDSELDRVARLTYPTAPPPAPSDSLRSRAVPPRIEFVPDVYNRRDVQQGCLPASGGVANARSVARLFAMLANRGELDGVRLLSEERVLSFLEPRAQFEEPDETYGRPMPVGMGGFQLYERGVIGSRPGARILCNVGAGGSLGWAHVDSGLAMAICHNRMLPLPEGQANSHEAAPFVPLGDAIRNFAAQHAI
jgi:CubicO group peptidase (beta-lactamase class C family)